MQPGGAQQSRDAVATVPVPTLARMAPCIASDRALGLLARGLVRSAGVSLRPSGIDALACCLARTLLSRRGATVALALPRGATGLPGMVSLFLVMQRWALPHVHGSVLLATPRGELAGELRDLTVEGAAFERMQVGRLVSREKPGAYGPGRVPVRQAMMRPLDRSGLRGLSQSDGYVLLARPGSIPTPPAPGVLSMAVIDTAGSSRPQPGAEADLDSPDAWSAAYRVLIASGTRMFWLGELGDRDFEAFCAARGIPLVQATWPLLEQCAQLERFETGGRLLSARGLAQRALERPPVAYRVVHDPEREELAAEAWMLLGKLRRAGRTGPVPAPVRACQDLLGVLSRLACPLDAHERSAAVGSPVFNISARGLYEQVRRADGSQFRGRWKEGYRRYWDSLKGVVRELVEHAEDEPVKLHALFDELADAQAQGRELVVCCQKETERRALIDSLTALDVADAVNVTTFSRRAHAGAASARRRVVLLGPPPPWQAPALLSGEGGDVLVLCYAYELRRLRESVADADARYGDDRVNAAALDELHVPAAAVNGWQPASQERLAARDPYGLPAGGEDPGAPDTEADNDGGDDAREPWREFIDLWGSEIEPGGGEGRGGDGQGAFDGFARLVRFVNAPPVALRNDRAVDVIADAEGSGLDDISAKLPGELSPGEHIAFVPGSEHHSLREAMMSAWDETLASERALLEPLWRAAIEQAVAAHGIEGLAGICDRHEATVRSWWDDRAAPQQADVFEAVLRASGNDAAWQARAAIWRFLQTTRTTHRMIGKKLRAALAEALSDVADQPAVRELEALTKTPVGDLLDIAEDLEVASVGSARRVALADCGHFLLHDHPLLQGDSP